MDHTLRALTRLGLIVLVTLSLASASYAQTAQQLQQLEDLTPAQRAALLEALGESDSGLAAEPGLTNPVNVTPREVTPAQPPPVSPAHEPLRPFGYDLFAGQPSTFAPATDIPIPVNYIIGPGDTIELQLFGSQSALYSLVVGRDGVLNVPEIGPVSVSGLKFSDMTAALQQRISEQLIGVRASITMGPLRSIRVFVLGDAYRPGSYTVSALSTMTNALLVSGGINSIGSLRNIQLKRNGQTVTTIDLYDLLLSGDTSGDARLQPGDVIFIPPVGDTVGVAGEVRRPAIYELRGEGSVSDILDLAGGILPAAYPEASQIERINSDRERTVIDVDLSTPDGLFVAVKGGDTIRVFSILEKREDVVLLNGHVFRPGPSQWREGMRITDLIPSIDELQARADLDYVLIRREIPEELRIGVFSADLGAALARPGSSDDIELHPRDHVFVFDVGAGRADLIEPVLAELRLQSSREAPTQVVTVNGRVRAPGRYPLEDEMRVSDLLRAGGRLDEAAYVLEAELTRFTIDVDQSWRADLISVNLAGVLAGDRTADLELAPHDVLSIKEIPEWRELEQADVAGEVRFPGSYPIRRGEKLSSLIARAGGLTDLASPEGAIFVRADLRLREQQQIAELANRLESEVESAAAASQEDAGEYSAARQALLDQVKKTEATGRLVIDLKSILADEPQLNADVVLQDGDRLLVPQRSQTVTVIGEVQFPTSHIFESGVDRNDYISRSGGMTADADNRRIYVVRADGSVESSNGSAFRRKGNSDIYPGDTIVVPLDADRMSKLSLWTNITTIIYNIGIAAAAVASF
jgi:polysaccharide export outer membrane protein